VIGHAVKALALCGMFFFAVWAKIEDGSLITWSNFDFYAGDDFAKKQK